MKLALILTLIPHLLFAAIDATAVWEVRASGSATNGGFYVSGGTDYSQQDAAQLALADGATDGAGTGLSSATGGFTAAMVGNGVYLTGGGSTTGWYEITVYTDTNNVTIDRSAGASKSGMTVNVGGAVTCVDAVFEAATAGNTYYIAADGTHTLSASVIVTEDGEDGAACYIEGYNSSRDDDPTGTNRPLISCGASYYFRPGDFWHSSNLRFSGSSAHVFEIGSNDNHVTNCYAENTSGTDDRDALLVSTGGGTVLGCEATSTNGEAFFLASASSNAIGCYAHDSKYGFRFSVDFAQISFCIADTCTTGVWLDTGSDGITVLNTTMYNCTTGLEAQSGERLCVVNCLIDSCTTGLSATTAGNEDAQYVNYNNYNNNGTDTSNVDKGANATSVVPGFNDAANGDFTVTTSAVAETGFPGDIDGTNVGYIGQGAMIPQDTGGSGGAMAVGY
jgi:hypothetical protein